MQCAAVMGGRFVGELDLSRLELALLCWVADRDRLLLLLLPLLLQASR